MLRVEPPVTWLERGDRGARLDGPKVLDGALPPKALALVVEWAAIHRAELDRDWERARARLPLEAIEPLR